MESVLYVCDLLSGMTRKGNIQISIQHKRFVIVFGRWTNFEKGYEISPFSKVCPFSFFIRIFDYQTHKGHERQGNTFLLSRQEYFYSGDRDRREILRDGCFLFYRPRT